MARSDRMHTPTPDSMYIDRPQYEYVMYEVTQSSAAWLCTGCCGRLVTSPFTLPAVCY